MRPPDQDLDHALLLIGLVLLALFLLPFAMAWLDASLTRLELRGSHRLRAVFRAKTRRTSR